MVRRLLNDKLRLLARWRCIIGNLYAEPNTAKSDMEGDAAQLVRRSGLMLWARFIICGSWNRR
jgi:hypothetical protein